MHLRVLIKCRAQYELHEQPILIPVVNDRIAYEHHTHRIQLKQRACLVCRQDGQAVFIGIHLLVQLEHLIQLCEASLG